RGAHARRLALTAVASRPRQQPAALLASMHRALAGSRGAAVAIAQHLPREGILRFAGIGNVAARLVDDTAYERLVSRPGIVGGPAGSRQPTDAVHPWRERSVLVMHTDGLTERWSTREWQGLTGNQAGNV